MWPALAYEEQSLVLCDEFETRLLGCQGSQASVTVSRASETRVGDSPNLAEKDVGMSEVLTEYTVAPSPLQ